MPGAKTTATPSDPARPAAIQPVVGSIATARMSPAASIGAPIGVPLRASHVQSSPAEVPATRRDESAEKATDPAELGRRTMVEPAGSSPGHVGRSGVGPTRGPPPTGAQVVVS